MSLANYIYTQLVGLGVPPSDARILTAIAYGESGYQKDILGDNNESVGLFQIHIPAHEDKLLKATGSNSWDYWVNWLKDIDNNIFMASQVYFSQGLGAWTIYNTGAYKPYLTMVNEGVSGGETAPLYTPTNDEKITWKSFIPAPMNLTNPWEEFKRRVGIIKEEFQTKNPWEVGKPDPKNFTLDPANKDRVEKLNTYLTPENVIKVGIILGLIIFILFGSFNMVKGGK